MLVVQLTAASQPGPDAPQPASQSARQPVGPSSKNLNSQPRRLLLLFVCLLGCMLRGSSARAVSSWYMCTVVGLRVRPAGQQRATSSAQYLQMVSLGWTMKYIQDHAHMNHSRSGGCRNSTPAAELVRAQAFRLCVKSSSLPLAGFRWPTSPALRSGSPSLRF